MSRSPIEITLYGASWIAHRDDGHDCTADPTVPHGVADTETGAVRALIRQETTHG